MASPACFSALSKILLISVSFLAFFLSTFVLINPIQFQHLVHNLRPRCNLTQICPWYSVRPVLPDGTQSTAIYDIPRRMLHHLPSHVISYLSPTARLVAHTQSPRIIILDSVLPPRFRTHLLSRARVILRKKRQRYLNSSLNAQHVILSPYTDDDEVRSAFHYNSKDLRSLFHTDYLRISNQQFFPCPTVSGCHFRR